MRTLTFLFASLALTACSGDVAEPEITHVDLAELTAEALRADQARVRGAAIARIDDNGRIRIFEDRLSRTFPDGGEIQRFAVTRLKDGFNLLRLGTNAKGANRTDALPLVQVGGRLFFGELKWIVACSPIECDEIGFCRPNYEKTDCFCADGKQCRFGIGDVPYDTVTLGNF